MKKFLFLINMKKKILSWQIVGMVFILFVGSFMHFLFELSGFWPPIGAIAAVNESVWEHLKLGYWPLVFYGIIEYQFIKKDANNFFMGTLISALSIIIIIPVFFYTYTAILGEHILFFDIMSFILAIIVGQLFSYHFMIKQAFSKRTQVVSIISLTIIGLFFIIFTYLPPHLPIFQDSLTGLYGIH
jgi:hypothetical protein